MSDIRLSIVRTLTWFDLFHIPITPFECWRYLWVEQAIQTKISFAEVEHELRSMSEQGFVCEELGMWRLKESDTTSANRLENARVAIAKRRRALRAARLLRHLPFVRFVGLGNTLALGVANKGNDIDLLIVLKHNRLFIGRLIVTAVIHALRWRRHDQHIANRLCLSFYLDDKHLGIESLAYSDDPYLVYWVASLFPLMGSVTYREFLLHNAWINKYLPNYHIPESLEESKLKFAFSCEPSRVMPVVEFVADIFFSWWAESLARVLQLNRIRRNRHTRLGDGTTAVVATNGVLKFHESDRRQQLAAEFRARLAAHSNPVL